MLVFIQFALANSVDPLPNLYQSFLMRSKDIRIFVYDINRSHGFVDMVTLKILHCVNCSSRTCIHGINKNVPNQSTVVIK